MVTDLHQTLKSLCFNTGWKYAVLWKLKHRSRMVLTCEDSYYDNFQQCHPLEKECSSEKSENLQGICYSRDLLGLAVAKMSYHVYSLGEGIVGQVAVSGKYQWIFADNHAANSFSSFEFSDGWQSQFMAGIKTIVVVAVVPYGVVQLGSLNKVVEDVRVVTHIKDAFLALQHSSVGHPSATSEHIIKSSFCAVTIQCSFSFSLFWHNHLYQRACNSYKLASDNLCHSFPHLQQNSDKSVHPCMADLHESAAIAVNKHEMQESSTSWTDEKATLVQLRGKTSSENQDQTGIDMAKIQMYGTDASAWKDITGVPQQSATPHSDVGPGNLKDTLIPNDKVRQPLTNFAANHLESNFCDKAKSDGIYSFQNMELNVPVTSGLDVVDNFSVLKYQTESAQLNPFKFSAGSELHEVLGPDYLRSCMYIDSAPQLEKTDSETVLTLPGEMSCSQMTCGTSSDNLLEAVVGNLCSSISEVKSDKSVCQSLQSLLTTDSMSDPSSQTKHITSSSCTLNGSTIVEEDTQNCSNSTGVYDGMSSKGCSSTYLSTCSEQLDRHSEPGKSNKKRAKPGEGCRPRPRDRQLIQDRIKELRELVPNGSKCSIDSLLERTIKHMVFMESITKHADKLSKCAESKLHKKGTDSSSFEQGSSWAVEVGGHLKVSSIIVENISKNGQMLVEMLCEECSHFLEIAEAIRSLGLTILKGITEGHGEKTWICFVVEGQNNKMMHRMDVLWSLVQLLQPKAINQ
ncbi:Transcription factor bHLH155 [Linum perenne]